jgi:hypothetical protein
VTVTTSGDKVVTLTTVAGVVMFVGAMADVRMLVIVVTWVVGEVVVIVVVYSGQEGADVASIDAIPEKGCEGVAVTVTTMVEGASYSVANIVDNNVDSFVSVTAGSVNAGSVTVVAAAAPVDPPSTGTTEYVAFLRPNGRSPPGMGRKGRASASVMTA